MMWLDDNAIRAFVGLMSAVVFHWLFNLLFSGRGVRRDLPISEEETGE